jgi:hypothetical protein
MFKDFSEEFQASVHIHQKALPFSSAKNEMPKHLQP